LRKFCGIASPSIAIDSKPLLSGLTVDGEGDWASISQTGIEKKSCHLHYTGNIKMETKVYANKGWQHIGTVPEAGSLYADGTWCFNTNERQARTCDSNGYGQTGNYYIMTIGKGDNRYPYHGDEAKVGQLIFRVGEHGSPEAMDLRGVFSGGEDLWMTINDSGIEDNDGFLTLRFVSAADSKALEDRMKPTNSYGDPIGTQYTRDAAGNYVRV
jgi:hypothetical protein